MCIKSNDAYTCTNETARLRQHFCGYHLPPSPAAHSLEGQTKSVSSVANLALGLVEMPEIILRVHEGVGLVMMLLCTSSTSLKGVYCCVAMGSGCESLRLDTRAKRQLKPSAELHVLHLQCLLRDTMA